MDFFKIRENIPKSGVVEIYPDFTVRRSRDLLVRGKNFYGIWDQEAGLWSTDEYDVARLVDQELYSYRDSRADAFGDSKVRVRTLSNFSSGAWKEFKKYLQTAPDSYHILDETVTFADTRVRKTDYVSKRLPYSLEDGSCDSYERIMSTLYDPEEREKLEWAIGSIIEGDSRYIQKFIVLYGEAGTGKSTVLNIIQMLFQGYYSVFEAKALASSNNEFATEAFRSNPLVAIQHDGDLSRIEDNTKLNSIISHEEMIINEKFKATYSSRINCFLFMGTNKPVKITDAKSGIIRRLIDVHPSGRKLPPKEYQKLMNQVPFELGAIAWHCHQVYLRLGKNYYSDYRPLAMIFQTDTFFNFVDASFEIFDSEESVTLKRAYDMYKAYCEDAAVDWKLPRHKFREELKNYFERFEDRVRMEGKFVRSVYFGFKREKFTNPSPSAEAASEEEAESEEKPTWLHLSDQPSRLELLCADRPAQYANEAGTPTIKWSEVKTKLRNLDTRRTHYVRLPLEHIVIDFDLKDEQGAKCLAKNLEAAAAWPPTYAEVSQGGQGLHLHYLYDGDARQLSRIFSEGIEVKVSVGNSSIRRRLSLCNDLPVNAISSGLPLKEVRKTDDIPRIQSERRLREMILRNLNKEYLDSTKPSVDFIEKLLNEAYDSGLQYDVSDMRPRIFSFAAHSTNQADTCIKAVKRMKFKGKEAESKPADISDESDLVFFDVEVFPNLFLVNWKFAGPDKQCVWMINPTPAEIEELMRYKLVGFNCRRYDNHILYARYLGYTNQQLYELSQKIIASHRDAMFGEAYNLSYTDVYDFSSKKQSLKKFEIELGIHHQELGLPWDQPVPEEKWIEVAEYCNNDVIATEAVFNARQADWTARKILAAVAGMSVNDTTNSLTTRIIFEGDKNPQRQFNYRFMGTQKGEYETYTVYPGTDPNYTCFYGTKPIFPGYTFDHGVSTYRGEEVGEGGYVYAEPGIHRNVALLDIASMHPSSIVAENLFGNRYTQRFRDILEARIAIKHGDFEGAKRMLDGKLSPYLDHPEEASNLAQALKIAINSVYGLTMAKFDNPFRDIRNVDNIVAKRGALFMINLKHEVQSRGFTVAHIKTDSIKIPDATPEIIRFVMDYGKLYGYNFEHEATYDRMCLVNDAVYIARYSGGKHDGEWTATGAQFAQPYVFKTLFSREPIEFRDLCEAKTVNTALYLDLNEDLPDGEHNYQFIGKAGLFCPILPGRGGGLLLREKDGKYSAAVGTKGFRWLESELVQALGKEDSIDRSYYTALVDAAVADISAYGDFEAFVAP